MTSSWNFSISSVGVTNCLCYKAKRLSESCKAYNKKYLDGRTRLVVFFLENKISENRKKVSSAPAISKKILKLLLFNHFLSNFQLFYTKIFLCISPFQKCQIFCSSVTGSRRPGALKSHIRRSGSIWDQGHSLDQKKDFYDISNSIFNIARKKSKNSNIKCQIKMCKSRSRLNFPCF